MLGDRVYRVGEAQVTALGEEQDTVTETGLGYPHTTEVPTQMKRGDLPGNKIGRRWVVPVGVWSRYVEGQWNGEAR